MTKLNISQDQLQALEICAQLLEVGNFSLSGKELNIAAQAKAILGQLIEVAKTPQEEKDVPASGPKRLSK